MSIVRVDPSIRKRSGKGKLTVDASTVREALAALEEEFPGIRGSLLDAGDRLQNFVLIYVDDEDIRYGSGLDTKLSPDSVVFISKAVAGG